MEKIMNVWLDMDGVLADFYGAMKEKFKLDWEDYPCPGEWDFFKHIPDLDLGKLDYMFWYRIPATDECDDILSFARSLGHVTILTNPYCGCYKESMVGKAMWINDRFSLPVLFAKDKGIYDGILIDDCDENLESFPGTKIRVNRPWNAGYKVSELLTIL